MFDVSLDAATGILTDFATTTGNPTTAGIYFDGHGSSVISQLQTFHNSSQIEIITQYNKLYATMLDLQIPYEQKSGIGGSYSIAGLASDGRTLNSVLDTYFSADSVITSGQTKRVAFPLLSSVFGASWTGDKAIPLDALNSDIVVELTLDNFANSFRTALLNTATTGPFTANVWLTDQAVLATPANIAKHITISNVQLVSQLVELDNATNEAYKRLHGPMIEIPVKQCRSYTSTIANRSNLNKDFPSPQTKFTKEILYRKNW